VSLDAYSRSEAVRILSSRTWTCAFGLVLAGARLNARDGIGRPANYASRTPRAVVRTTRTAADRPVVPPPTTPARAWQRGDLLNRDAATPDWLLQIQGDVHSRQHVHWRPWPPQGGQVSFGTHLPGVGHHRVSAATPCGVRPSSRSSTVTSAPARSAVVIMLSAKSRRVLARMCRCGWAPGQAWTDGGALACPWCCHWRAG
jgi:hypothetical protein